MKKFQTSQIVMGAVVCCLLLGIPAQSQADVSISVALSSPSTESYLINLEVQRGQLGWIDWHGGPYVSSPQPKPTPALLFYGDKKNKYCFKDFKISLDQGGIWNDLPCGELCVKNTSEGVYYVYWLQSTSEGVYSCKAIRQ